MFLVLYSIGAMLLLVLIFRTHEQDLVLGTLFFFAVILATMAHSFAVVTAYYKVLTISDEGNLALFEMRRIRDANRAAQLIG